MQKTLENNKLTISLEGRIDSTNATEWDDQINEAVDENPEANIILDASKLEYISSAGLRILMKLCKKSKNKMKVTDVSSEVYDIFEVTGFSELINVEKAMRRVSKEGLEVIGKGATSEVYRLDKETVLKVFKPGTSMEIIRNENQRSKNAFLSGIPTAISYDIVKVGDCYGAVYELLDAKDFLTVIENDKEHLVDHIRKFAKAMREMHKIEVDPQKFPPTKAGSLYVLPRLEGICTKEEIDKLRKLYETIPDRNTFIHGDCHTGNVMLQNDELVFIDLMTCGCGHPVFDLGSMCSVYHMPPKFGSREASPLTRNFTEEESKLMWDTYLRSYLDSDDEEFIRKVERQVTAISSARTLFAALFMPGLIPASHLEFLKKTALAYVDEGLEPINWG
ncbi:MAG: anti-sigma factor antagonist [Lachnospiraceae bacterium]|nr:anti-sigma factor antagonist [Lachnospiraceae bacterium]